MKSSTFELGLKGRFPPDEFLRAKQFFLLSHELSAGTNDGAIQFKQCKVDSRGKIHLVENELNGHLSKRDTTLGPDHLYIILL